MIRTALTFLACTAFMFSATAAETPAQKAEAMVKKAAAHIKAVGKEKALVDLNDMKGKFVDGEYYVFAYTLKNVCLALAPKPAQVGKDLTDIVDADGKPLVQELNKIATTKGSGWYDYKWNNPLTKKIQDKTSFVMLIDGQDMFIGCGYYK